MLFYNATNKHIYSEHNAQKLAAAAERNGWASNEFAGFDQWKKAGRIVKGGQKGTPLTLFVEKKQADGSRKKVRKVKFVFNIEQTDVLQQSFVPAGGAQ
jgi:N-terminal domain of anti-restriction factor ArdC